MLLGLIMWNKWLPRAPSPTGGPKIKWKLVSFYPPVFISHNLFIDALPDVHPVASQIWKAVNSALGNIWPLYG